MSKPRKRDPAKLLTELRRKSAELIGLDPDKLSAADAVLVARIGTLRLLLDDLESAQLRGEAIDAGRYCAASEQYEALLRHKSAGAVSADGTSVTLDAARRRMAELLGLVVDADGNIDEPPVSESQRKIDELKAEVAALKERLTARIEPSPPQQQKPLSPNVVPLQRTPPSETAVRRAERIDAQPPPAHYLARHDEPWRGFVGPDGPVVNRGGVYWGPI